MANTFAPFGFRSFGHQDGSAPTMGLSRYFISSGYATNVFTGDVVSLSSGTPGTIELSTSALAVAVGIKPLGVFAGCEFFSAAASRVLWSAFYPSGGATGSVTAYVISDPEMQFVAQASSGAVVGTSLTGLNIGYAIGTGNTLTGQSGAFLQSSNIGTASSSFPWRVVDAYSNFGPPGSNGASTSEGGGWLVVQPTGWMRNTVSLTGVTT